MQSKYICPTEGEYLEAKSFLWSQEVIKQIQFDVDGNYAVIYTEELPI